jgi:hypothetical protein
MPDYFVKHYMKFTFRGFKRGDVCFAANVLGARGALLLALVHFFEHARWGSPVETGAAEQSLTAEDQLFILTQATLDLTATRGPTAPEMRICYELAEPLCHSLNRPLLLCVTLMGQWRYSLDTDKLTATMRIAERVCALAEEQNNPALIVGAYHISAATLENPDAHLPCRSLSTIRTSQRVR